MCSFTWIYHFSSQIHYISSRKVHLITKFSLQSDAVAVCSFETFPRYKCFPEAAEVECGVSPLVLINPVFVFSIHTHTRWRGSPRTHPSGWSVDGILLPVFQTYHTVNCLRSFLPSSHLGHLGRLVHLGLSGHLGHFRIIQVIRVIFSTLILTDWLTNAKH